MRHASSLFGAHSGRRFVRPDNQCRISHPCSVTQPILSSTTEPAPLAWSCTHVRWGILKVLLYEELPTVKRARGWHPFRIMSIFKRDMSSMDIDIENWDDYANNLWRRRRDLHWRMQREEEIWRLAALKNRGRLKENNVITRVIIFTCIPCSQARHTRMGLCSNNKFSTTTSSWSITLWEQVPGFLKQRGLHTQGCVDHLRKLASI